MALVLGAGASLAWAGDDLPFANIGPALPSLAEYAVTDSVGVAEDAAHGFLVRTARFGWETEDLSQLAAWRGERLEVRRFAVELAKTQAAMNTELADLAARKGRHLPGSAVLDQREWARKTGEEFDRDYLARVIELHAAAIERCEVAAAQGGDEDVAAWAAKCLPILQEHERRARELAETP